MAGRVEGKVALTDRNEAGVREVAGALGESTRAWKLDVTREADWYLASDESKLMTGSELVVDGGSTAM